LSFCVSLTSLSKCSKRRGCRSFQLAAYLGFSSWRRRDQLSACSRSASMTIVAMFSSPNFWTWSSRGTWQHYVLMTNVSLSLPQNFLSLGFVTSILALLLSLVAILFSLFCSFFCSLITGSINDTSCVDSITLFLGICAFLTQSLACLHCYTNTLYNYLFLLSIDSSRLSNGAINSLDQKTVRFILSVFSFLSSQLSLKPDR
jgi:hypothetical protein